MQQIPYPDHKSRDLFSVSPEHSSKWEKQWSFTKIAKLDFGRLIVFIFTPDVCRIRTCSASWLSITRRCRINRLPFAITWFHFRVFLCGSCFSFVLVVCVVLCFLYFISLLPVSCLSLRFSLTCICNIDDLELSTGIISKLAMFLNNYVCLFNFSNY